MKTIRASAFRLTSEVVVGSNKYSGDVTVMVTLDRRDPEVLQALSELDGLLRRRAFAQINEAVEEATVQRRVTESLNAQRAQLVRTAKLNAEATMEGKIRGLERELSAARGMTRTVESRLNTILNAQAVTAEKAQTSVPTPEKES